MMPGRGWFRVKYDIDIYANDDASNANYDARTMLDGVDFGMRCDSGCSGGCF